MASVQFVENSALLTRLRQFAVPPVAAEPSCDCSAEATKFSPTNGYGHGRLIVNADDWGRDCETTDKALECHKARALSSVSAMVFMADSARGAALAQEYGVDAGLHLNLTAPFTAHECPPRLVEKHTEIIRYLRRHRFASVVFHPGLTGSFAYVVEAQLEEYSRLYSRTPKRLDGHHHMHLCANVLLARLLPEGTIVRRNFSFQRGEKSWGNRLYRKMVDRMLARRHPLTDLFYSLPPLQPTSRLERIFSLARQFVVEIETHPINPTEYAFLMGGEMLNWAGQGGVAPAYLLN